MPDATPTTCPKCDREFPSPRSFRSHWGRSHKDTELTPEPVKSVAEPTPELVKSVAEPTPEPVKSVAEPTPEPVTDCDGTCPRCRNGDGCYADPGDVVRDGKIVTGEPEPVAEPTPEPEPVAEPKPVNALGYELAWKRAHYSLLKNTGEKKATRPTWLVRCEHGFVFTPTPNTGAAAEQAGRNRAEWCTECAK